MRTFHNPLVPTYFHAGEIFRGPQNCSSQSPPDILISSLMTSILLLFVYSFPQNTISQYLLVPFRLALLVLGMWSSSYCSLNLPIGKEKL